MLPRSGIFECKVGLLYLGDLYYFWYMSQILILFIVVIWCRIRHTVKFKIINLKIKQIIAYCGERAWKDIGDSLKWPHYLSKVDHVRKIRTRRQRTDRGKYSYVNRTIGGGDWTQLPAEVLEILPCKPTTFRKRLKEAIIERHQGTPKWAKSID
jgi:hypothetical protein